MTRYGVSEGFGFLGAAVGVVMVVPQMIRVLRHPRLAGVSGASWSLTAMACLTWLGYGIRTRQLPQIPGNVLLVSGAAAIVLLVPGSLSRSRRAVGLLAAATIICALVAGLPPRQVGFVAFAITLIASWPQLYDSFRSWQSRRRSAVSVPAWTLRALSQVCWLTYAIGTRDSPVIVSAGVTLTSASVLVALETFARAQP